MEKENDSNYGNQTMNENLNKDNDQEDNANNVKHIFKEKYALDQDPISFLSFDDYTGYLNIRNKRIKIFLFSFFVILLLLGISTVLTLYTLVPCIFVRCHQKATCLNRYFYPQCVCNYGYAGNGFTECEECGLSFYENNLRIVHGIEAKPHSWPFNVLILRFTKASFLSNKTEYFTEEIYSCGGSLINKYTVLTAAHCVYDHKINNFTKKNRKDYKNIYKVFVGFHDLSIINKTINDTEFLSLLGISVDKIILHDSFDIHTLKNDIAILKLSEPVNFGPYTQTVCLPKRDGNIYPDVNKTAFIVGWGLTDEKANETENILRNAKLKILDENYCNYTSLNISNFTKSWIYQKMKYPKKRNCVKEEKLNTSFLNLLDSSYDDNEQFYPNLFYSKSQICAGDLKESIDSCKGDSGSALITKETIHKKSRSVISGIVSFGFGCGNAKYPGIYTRTSYFLDWILKNSNY